MKRIIIPSVITILFFFLYSCIEFRIVNQPTISAPNEIITVEITAYSERGGYVPYFGVCIPIGWTIPGDSLRCYGAYDMVIYYDSLVSLEQDSVSPAPMGYYWWAGKGEEGGGEGISYANLKIQTDSQVGVFSIDYMLGSNTNGVNYTRSDGHLIEITSDPILISVDPETGYQNITMDIDILGLNTHFNGGSGTQNVWLSQKNDQVYANSIVVNNNTSLVVNFSIPGTAPLGRWDVNVETDIDGIITKTDGFEIFPPVPAISVTPDSIYIEVLPGSIRTKTITISNNGWNDLIFNILPSSGFALQFDGVDDEVVIGFDSTLDITSDITICAWYKTTSPHWGALISNYDQDSPDNGYELCSSSMYNDGGFIYYECAYDNLRDGFSTDSSFNDSDWHFVSAIYSPNGYCRGKVFVDGIEQTGTFLPGSVQLPAIGTTPDYPFKIGAAYNEAFFEGFIDEVSIWNAALTQEDILYLKNGILLGTEFCLAGYWQFNEGSGNTTSDKAIYDNDGTLLNGVQWIISEAPISQNWLSFSPDSGFCYPDSSIEITLTFNASELCLGHHYGLLVITSNDPLNSNLIIPIDILVSLTPGIENESSKPSVFCLFQNYPNPLNPSTTIQYSIKERTPVELVLYDILGRVVEVLVNEEQDAGYYKVNFNAKNLASGIYFYRLKAGDFVETKKMLLIK